MAKKVLNPFKLVSAGDMSGNITSNPVDVRGLDNVSLQAIYTGSPVGSLSIEASLNYGIVGETAAWSPVTLGGDTSISAAGNQSIDLNQLSYPWVRIKYAFTSGTGSLTVWAFGKEIS